MSSNRKNNHYHYAEKFEPREHRHARGRSKTAYVPTRAAIFTLFVLLVFGLISTTFAVYVSDMSDDIKEGNTDLIVTARNINTSREVALTGGKVDVASTGGQYNYNWDNAKLYFRVPDGWNIGSTYKYYGVITRTNAVGTASYVTYTGQMTRIDNTRLYYVNFSINHSSWGQNEYFAVVGGTTTKTNNGDGVDSVRLNSHTYYTQPADYGMANNTYLATATANNTALSISYLNNNDYDGLFKKNQTVNLKVGSSASTACGTVTLTGYYNSENGFPITLTSSSASSTLNSTSTASYAGVEGSKMTLTASPATGYRFDGFYSGSTKVSDDDSLTYEYYVFGTATYTAKFIRTYDITVKKNAAGYNYDPYIEETDTYTEVTNGRKYTLDSGTSYTVNAALQTGVTVQWSGNNTTANARITGSTATANRTYTATYTLTQPTITTMSYVNNIVAGTASTLTKTVSSATNNSAHLSYAYSAAVRNSTVASSSTWSFDSSGNFTATLPGEYRITMTVTCTAYGLTSSRSQTFDITVKPPQPSNSFTYTVSGYSGEANGTTGLSSDNPYMVRLNSDTFTVTPTFTDPVTSPAYTYNWTITDTYSGTTHTKSWNGVTTYTDRITDADTPLWNTPAAAHTYHISLTANYNGVASTARTTDFYYTITADYLEVTKYGDATNGVDTNYTPQKIYSEDTAPTQIDARYAAGGTDTFHTLFTGSTDGKTYTPPDEVYAPAGHPVTFGGNSYTATPNNAAHITAVLKEAFSIDPFTGIKYFLLYVDDWNNNNVSAVTQIMHTVVGTSSGSTDRTIYFQDGSNVSYTNAPRYMLFYLENGELKYQTAQQTTVNGASYYRFNVPSSVSDITIAVAKSEYYMMPSVSNGTLGFTSDYYYAFAGMINLNSELNAGKNLFTACTTYTTSNGVKLYQDADYSANGNVLGMTTI